MYILSDGNEVTADAIKSAYAEGRAVLVHTNGDGRTHTSLSLDGQHRDTRDTCYSVWDEVWTQTPSSLAEALRAAYYNPNHYPRRLAGDIYRRNDMSVVLYKTDNDYYYAVEICMPEQTVRFGEGNSPAGAVNDLTDTQYQSADLGCRGPANSQLAEYFDSVDEDDEIYDCNEIEEAEAEAAYDLLPETA